MSTRVNEDRVRQWWSLRTTSVVRGQFVFFIRLTFRRDTTFQVQGLYPSISNLEDLFAILYLETLPDFWNSIDLSTSTEFDVGDLFPKRKTGSKIQKQHQIHDATLLHLIL